jgi:hypothetical protein
MSMIFLTIAWFVFAIIIGVAAHSRKRSGFGWFLLSLIFSPLLTTVWLLILPRRLTRTRREAIEMLRSLRECPYCAETIKREAKGVQALSARTTSSTTANPCSRPSILIWQNA